MTRPTCLNCAYLIGPNGPCLPGDKAPGLRSWIIDHWVSDETPQTTPCPYHHYKEASMANTDGSYTPNWPVGQTLADYDKLVEEAREARETWLADMGSSPKWGAYLTALGPLVGGEVVTSGLSGGWWGLNPPRGPITVGEYRVDLQAIVSARRAELAAAKPSPQDTAKLTHEEDGSYTIVVPDATCKSMAYAAAQARGKTIGIPAWAWRKDHVYPNGDKRLDPEVYRYRTGTPASLEAQWRRLIEEGVLPKDDPRPLILGQATPTERRLRDEPPEALLRLLSSPDQNLLKTIWPGYVARETDAQMADRTWSQQGAEGYSASTIRRLRQRCNLPTMRAGSGLKAGRLPDICYEVVPAHPEPDLAHLGAPSRGPHSPALPAVEVNGRILALVAALGLEAEPRETWTDLLVRAEAKAQLVRDRLPYPRIEKVKVYEGNATTNAILIFTDGTEARLSVPHQTKLPGIVDALREAGWTGVPPAAEFQKVYNGQFQYPEEEILIEIDSKRINPLADNLGLAKPEAGYFYKARDPFTAAALRRAGLPYRVPVYVSKFNVAKWVEHTAIVIPCWGAK